MDRAKERWKKGREVERERKRDRQKERETDGERCRDRSSMARIDRTAASVNGNREKHIKVKLNHHQYRHQLTSKILSLHKFVFLPRANIKIMMLKINISKINLFYLCRKQAPYKYFAPLSFQSVLMFRLLALLYFPSHCFLFEDGCKEILNIQRFQFVVTAIKSNKMLQRSKKTKEKKNIACNLCE